MKEFQDLVTLAPWTFIFQICNLLILTAAVKHFLFKPVQNVLAKRKAQVEDTYANAEKAESEALAMREDCEKRLSGQRAEKGRGRAEKRHFRTGAEHRRDRGGEGDRPLRPQGPDR